MCVVLVVLSFLFVFGFVMSCVAFVSCFVFVGLFCSLEDVYNNLRVRWFFLGCEVGLVVTGRIFYSSNFLFGVFVFLLVVCVFIGVGFLTYKYPTHSDVFFSGVEFGVLLMSFFRLERKDRLTYNFLNVKKE